MYRGLSVKEFQINFSLQRNQYIYTYMYRGLSVKEFQINFSLQRNDSKRAKVEYKTLVAYMKLVAPCCSCHVHFSQAFHISNPLSQVCHIWRLILSSRRR